MNTQSQHGLAQWHDFVNRRDTSILNDLLHDDVMFYSPVLWKPKQGKLIAFAILSTVIEVFENFTYHREWENGDSWALEFSAHIGDVHLKGIDLIQFDENGKIINFEVMVRPLNALQTLGAEMAKRLNF